MMDKTHIQLNSKLFAILNSEKNEKGENIIRYIQIFHKKEDGEYSVCELSNNEFNVIFKSVVELENK